MKIELDLPDAMADHLRGLAADDHRTVEEYARLVLHRHLYGVGGTVTDEEYQALRAKRPARVPRITLKAKDRNRLFERFDGRCFHCAGTILYDELWHIDHLMPISKGGTNDIANLVLSCVRCNLEKSDAVVAL